VGRDNDSQKRGPKFGGKSCPTETDKGIYRTEKIKTELLTEKENGNKGAVCGNGRAVFSDPEGE